SSAAARQGRCPEARSGGGSRACLAPVIASGAKQSSLRSLDCFVTALLAMTTGQRTAIVTGAGKRVGADIARALLADGWTVVAHAHNFADELPESATDAVAH